MTCCRSPLPKEFLEFHANLSNENVLLPVQYFLLMSTRGFSVAAPLVGTAASSSFFE